MGGLVGDITDAIGLTDYEGQEDAARDATRAHTQSGADSIAVQRESRDLARADLSPFVSFATGNFGAPAVSPVAAPGNQLIDRNRTSTPVQTFMPGSTTNPGYTSSSPMGRYAALLDPANQASFLESNPMFKAAMGNINRGTRNAGYMSGLKGDMQSQLMQDYFATGNQFVDAQLNRLLQPIQVGQASAAGQASGTLQTGANIGNTMTGIGNAQAAGIIGAQNARGNPLSDLLNTGLQGAAIYSVFNR